MAGRRSKKRRKLNGFLSNDHEVTIYELVTFEIVKPVARRLGKGKRG